MTIKKIAALPLTVFTFLSTSLPALAANDVIGTIQAPAGVFKDTRQTTNLINAVIIVFLVISGIWTLWQFLTAGLGYITSNGDKGKITQATSKLTMAITGLVVIAASFILMYIISYILFGKASFILNPQLKTI